jgi:hypothetical protein
MKKIAFGLLASFVLLNACMNGPRVKGDGNMTTQTKTPGDFTGVESHGSFDVYLTQGSSAGVKIEGEQNILSYLDIHVENGILNVDTKDNVWLDPTQTVKIYVTAPSYRRIENNGSGNMASQTKLSNDAKMDISSTGSGTMTLDVDAPEIESNVTGSGGVSLSGETKKLGAEVTGSGDLNALNLMTEESIVGITGSGNISVNSSVKLDARITGSGGIRYKGNAQVNSNVTGSGTVSKVD